jgi:hypothetical protein
LERWVRGAFFHFESILVRLEQPAGVGRRLEQPGVMTHFWGEEEKTWPGQLGGALSAGSFCDASLEKPWKIVWGQHQTFWDSSLLGKGAVWGAEERELGTPGLEEEPLQRLGEGGK